MQNKLRFNRRYIEIECYDAESQYLAGQIPYVHKSRNQRIFRTSVRNIDLVLRLFRGIDIYNRDAKTVEFLTNGPSAILHLLDAEMQRRMATKELLEVGPKGETVTEYITLRRHQQLGVELAQVNNKWAFFYDTRTGKTPMSLQIITEDLKRNPTNKWLILCPLVLIENAWLQDARDMFPHLSVVSLHGRTRKERLEKFKQDANVYILNIESYISYADEVAKLGIHGCIVDESSAMKSNSSKFAKAAVEFAQTLERWYLLSGSPAPNGEHEYYLQLKSIDPYGVHESYNQFKKYFFDNISRNPQYDKLVLKPERRDEFHALLRKYSLYVDKEEVLTTPGREFKEVRLKLPEELRELYEELRKELAVRIKDEVVTAPSSAALLGKLNQVTSGFIIDTNAVKHNLMVKAARKNGQYIPPELDIIKEEVHGLNDYRFKALMELLNSFGNDQAIIWCNYHEEFRHIKDLLKERCGIVNGQVDIFTKNDNIEAFKAGSIQFLIANPASIGKGLTLTNAHICVYFSMNYSYELWKQSIERIYGDISKQPKKCLYYIFIAENTIDRHIYTAVKKKGDVSLEVLNHLKGGL